MADDISFSRGHAQSELPGLASRNWNDLDIAANATGISRQVIIGQIQCIIGSDILVNVSPSSFLHGKVGALKINDGRRRVLKNDKAIYWCGQIAGSVVQVVADVESGVGGERHIDEVAARHDERVQVRLIVQGIGAVSSRINPGNATFVRKN